MKSNSEILLNLIKKYQEIKNPLDKKQPILIDRKHQDVNYRETIDTNGIDLILIGDNPGTKEYKGKEYFRKVGKGASAGNFAHAFLDQAEYYYSIAKGSFSYLLLNKTPFSTSSTKKIVVNDAVKDSIKELQRALMQFINTNPNVIILIVGYNDNDLNKHFYREEVSNWPTELLIKTRFASHFSNGWFHYQWARYELKGMKSLGGASISSTLNMINEETCERIKDKHGVNLTMVLPQHEMNELLQDEANTRKQDSLQSKKVLSFPDSMEKLIEISRDISANLIFLEDISAWDLEINLNPKNDQIKSLIGNLTNLEKEKTCAVNDGNYEDAANFRDKIKSLREMLNYQIMENKDFIEGFNSINGSILVCPSRDIFKSTVLEEFKKAVLS
jgi:hypothetical protein